MTARKKTKSRCFSLFTGLFLLLTASLIAQEAEKEILPADESDPAHIVLYKSGFYREAIAILEEKVKNRASPEWLEHARLLSFCYVLTDQKRSAVEWFRLILETDSTFVVDSMDVPPKIAEVFREAREEWQRFHQFAAASTDFSPTPMMEGGPLLPEQSRFETLYNFLPGGVGQFRKGHKKRGITLLALESLTLGVSLLAYYKLQNSKHPDFGMWPGNEKEIRFYLDLYRIPFGMFVFSYAYGVIDAFVAEGESP